MVDTTIAGLEAARSRIEEKFSEAGGFLQETLKRIDEQLDVLAELGKALDPQSVGSATQDLMATANALFGAPAILATREQRLQLLKRQGSDLRTNISEVQGLMRYLRAFAFNVKITAAGTGVQAEQFNSFAGEMGGRIDYGEKQIAEFWACLKALEHHIDTALDSEGKLVAEAKAVLPDVPQGLIADATSIEKFHARATESASTVRALAKRIQVCILSALSALQIGDTIRQRIEHVQNALASLSELDARLAEEATPPELRRHLESYVCAMLAAQLEDASEFFEAEAARMIELIGQIAVDTHELAESLNFDRAGDEEDGLRSLEQSVAKALLIVSGMEQAAERADELHAATSDAVQGLVQRVTSLREVKDDVQYMALNTSLRCVHIGEAGRPLQVVATELSIYAKRLEMAASTTMQSVEALALANSEERDAASAGASSRSTLDSAVACLRAAADVVEKDLSLAMTKGKDLAARLGTAEQKLNFKAEFVDVIRRAAADLAKRAGDMPSDLSSIETPLGEIMAGIAKSYTMAREREVHAHFMPGDGTGAETAKAADDDGDIEMFA